MNFYYISPSTLPSKTANSVHVAMQCAGLTDAGAQVTLFAHRSIADKKVFARLFKEFYGANCPHSIVSFYSNFKIGLNLRIAFLALWHFLNNRQPDLILSRNLYASFILGVLLRRPLIFETHQLEMGLRKLIQNIVMTRPRVTTLVISKKLAEYLEIHHGNKPNCTLVLHDAAKDGIEPFSTIEKQNVLSQIQPVSKGQWMAVCGYFGHLYAGRGVEIIEEMAAARPNVLFLIYGGNDVEVKARTKANTLSNLCYMGHIPHQDAQRVMGAVDILLMPYLESVSIGVAGQDTAKWMSPMKMFEYMASGVPLISSDLPVLREVLRNGENALLVPPNDTSAWVAALDKLCGDSHYSKQLGQRAHKDYKNQYTWHQRAQRILEAANK